MSAKSFIFGVVVGGVLCGTVGYFAGKFIAERNKEAEIEEREKAAWDYFREKYGVKSIVGEKEDPSEIVKKIEKDEYERQANVYNTVTQVDPAEIEHPSEEDAPDEYYDEDSMNMAVANAESVQAIAYDKMHGSNPPTIISDIEYGGTPGYDTAEVTYYTETGVYVDEQSGFILEDFDRNFGNCIESIGWDRDPDQIQPIYIRNFNYQTDYCISKVFGKVAD